MSKEQLTIDRFLNKMLLEQPDFSSQALPKTITSGKIVFTATQTNFVTYKCYYPYRVKNTIGEYNKTSIDIDINYDCFESTLSIDPDILVLTRNGVPMLKSCIKDIVDREYTFHTYYHTYLSSRHIDTVKKDIINYINKSTGLNQNDLIPLPVHQMIPTL